MDLPHAEPDTAATHPTWLEVAVADDGRCIPGEYRAGVGLNAMRERVAELGGTWLLEPNGARGTRVIARLPVPRGGV
jgi:glucose-6-phosphate-specific signal transduction histidine kinase